MSAPNLPTVASDETASADVPSQDTPPEGPTPAPDRAAGLEQELATLKDQLLRHRADFANYKRRVERDQRLSGEAEVAALLSDLLPSLDALEKALAAQGTAQEIRAGVEITLKDVATTLAGRGVRVDDPTGEKFDPLRHEALSYEPVPGVPDGVIATCYRKGYIMGDRLIRPALVKVARPATEAEEPTVIVPVSH
jgi:molecular chaperone GrpE